MFIFPKNEVYYTLIIIKLCHTYNLSRANNEKWAHCSAWTAAHQAPPSLEFSRQEYWSGVPLPSPTYSSSEPVFIRGF